MFREFNEKDRRLYTIMTEPVEAESLKLAALWTNYVDELVLRILEIAYAMMKIRL